MIKDEHVKAEFTSEKHYVTSQVLDKNTYFQIYSVDLSVPLKQRGNSTSLNSLMDDDFDRVTRIFTKYLLTWLSSNSQIFPSTLNLLLNN